MINIVTSSRYKVDRKKISTLTEESLNKREVSPELTLNVVFVGKNKMKEIAKKYKKENIALPVLSFNYMQEPKEDERLMGEIIICYPQAILLAAEREKKVDTTIMQLIDHGIENILSEQSSQ